MKNEECDKYDCPGCLGLMWECGHTFKCSKNPESINHDCQTWFDKRVTPLIFTGAYAAFMLWLILGRP